MSQKSLNFFMDATDELARATVKHPGFKSLHEAYAVILEEVDEFWDEVKKKAENRNPTEVYAELVQIAAMCGKAAELL